MRRITKAHLIESVADRWKAQPRNPDNIRAIEIGEILAKERPKTEDRIEEIIGNRTWTENICYECRIDNNVVIEIGECELCEECLKEAVELAIGIKINPN